ncbi:hypothetical protein [Methylobacterium sp. J-068]|uniref:hypothetical protein n=1 Tax=Methylobacterium sp. J-068 TaxID=2836649 RepID=UPI001FBB20A6|nr:hypothetical protein [Methylobacterium sp. J-068]MCJ2036750.1 hypothetical protein [Methylobacterium sp. J-068]
MRPHLVLAALTSLIGTVDAGAFPARMRTFEKVVSAGHTLTVASFSSLDPTCRSLGPMSVSLIDTAHDGRVQVEEGRDFPSFSTLNTRSRCNSRKVPTTFVRYTPSPGYTGEDEFALEFVSPGGDVGRARFHITVR